MYDSLNDPLIREEKDNGFMARHYMLGYIFGVFFFIISIILLVFLVINEENCKPNSKNAEIENLNALPYFKSVDVVKYPTTKTLKTLKNFIFEKSSSKSTEGAAAHNVLSFFGVKNASVEGKTNKEITKILKNYGLNVESNSGNTENPFGDEKGFKNFISESIAQNKGVLLMCADPRANWGVVVGFDDMGTESLDDDAVIVADYAKGGYEAYELGRLYSQIGNKCEKALPEENRWSYIRVSENNN